MSDPRSWRSTRIAGRAYKALNESEGAVERRTGERSFSLCRRRAVGRDGRRSVRLSPSRGIEAEHRLLDIGCGTLRGGVIDISQEMLDAGEQELALAGISNRRHTLRQTSEFDMRFADTQFDYALAQSVFTHIDLNQILRCVLNVQRVLAPAGRFYATFLENPAGKNSLDPVRHPQPDVADTVTYLDRDPFHYSLDAFEWACSGTEL